MSITFKAEIKKGEQRKDESWQVKIRITKDRKVCRIPTNFYVSKAHISRRTLEITDVDILKSCQTLINDFRDIANRMGDELNVYDVKYLAKYLVNEKAKQTNRGIVDIIIFAEKHVEKLKLENRVGYANSIHSTVQWLKKNYNTLPVTRITLVEIESMQVKMLETRAQTSVNIHLRNIRTLFNACVDSMEDDSMIKRYPFRRFKFRPDDKPKDKTLDIETIRKIIFFPDHHLQRVNMARDVFTLSFALLGMNAKDIYCCMKFEGNRIEYIREKTKRKGEKALIAPLVTDEIRAILDKYRDSSGERVFNFYKQYHVNENFVRAVNKGLSELCKEAKIEMDVTTYSARHSFATIACNDCDISTDNVSVCLTHSTGFNITEKYIKRDWSKIDRAQRAVLDLVFHNL